MDEVLLTATDLFLGVSKEIIQDLRDMAPPVVAFFYPPTEPGAKYDYEVSGLDLSNDLRKEKTFRAIRDYARLKGALAVLVAAEVWQARSDERDRRRPAERPDRSEAIIVSMFTPKDRLVLTVPIRRGKDGAVEFGEREVARGASCPMDPWEEERAKLS